MEEIIDNAAEDKDSEDDRVRNDEPPSTEVNTVVLLTTDDANEIGRVGDTVSQTYDRADPSNGRGVRRVVLNSSSSSTMSLSESMAMSSLTRRLL